MATLKRSDMFKKLGAECYRAIEGATILAKARGNPYVELVHWVNQLILSENTDWHGAISFFALDEAKIAKDLISAMDGLQRGASGISDFSPAIERAIKEAWMISSIQFGEGAIRSGHLLAALKGTPELCQLLHGISGEFVKINGDLLLEKFADVTAASAEVSAAAPAGGAVGSAAPSAGPAGKGEALRLYTVDMTAHAAAGKIDNVVGRDVEIRKIVDILMRRRQNNPILTGDAGVGKTAVVEGFARRLASGDVPPSLKGNKLHSLDIGLLQAGASMKGEFEKRLKDVIDDVQPNETPIIISIDEAHTLIGTGGAVG
jgi:type VI secretion system protein VasG